MQSKFTMVDRKGHPQEPSVTFERIVVNHPNRRKVRVPKAACQNCDWVGPVSDVKPDIPDYDERVAPGEAEPCGECPRCGALCHEI